MFDKSKIAHSIVQKLSDGGEVQDPTGQTNDGPDDIGIHTAAQEMIDAFHNKSPQDLHRALSSYIELHKQIPSGDNEPSE